MSASSIVERFDVIKDIRFSQITRFVDPLLDVFHLQTAEDGLGHRIVPAVAASAHANQRGQIYLVGTSNKSVPFGAPFKYIAS